MSKIREMLISLNLIKSNIEYIAKTGKINGTLLLDLESLLKRYHRQQLQEIKREVEMKIKEEEAWLFGKEAILGMVNRILDRHMKPKTEK